MADKFHSQGAEETYELLADMIDKHHPDLRQTEVLVLMKHGGWKSKGKPVFGKFKVLGDDLRTTWMKDAILYLNADMWGILSEPQRRYVLDHALYGLDVKVDKDGETKLAEDDRPLLKTVSPDIEAFVEVIKRHGTTTQEVKRLAAAIKEVNPDQVTIEDVIGAGGKQQGGEDPKPPGNGLTVKRNPDGSVDVDDPNQTKLDDFTGDPDDKKGPPMPNDADSLPL
ncbi:MULTISPECIES: putative metallopeptidase [unclassified Paenibacillus]|uniref:putative metallopeptidase n=1 Tax=unclassified Paenibacillus TaxID=185978 RepID=UPI002405385B|nr:MULTISPECIES: putative metallopeptidase [unclassified Paenibacillus]MDF9844165.1 hypothetical protein [Paenibacillus sp. PastF-2]MDF9850713.1 hypothetical protein [Paenibacillus sp. PastM-2]MDF9857284.1 hypothetical protein [Paenibacillus sp. PastF-1]MDH6482608.1 hypothetical protein [Paenibacillus sp. PastH-2]MDH6510035.1 hypothetical protein [Paenibacillus sp. PastM-3]